MTSPADGFRRLVSVLDRLGIGYMIGGSLASSVHGVPRSTNDIDIVADIRPQQLASWIAELKSEFYLDPPEAIEQALCAGRMFNLIHLETGYKYDFYPMPSDPYSQMALSRRREVEYALDASATLQFYVASAEDTVLAKLSWYRAGGRVSERQWADVLDVIRIQGDRLDLVYLRRWAAALDVGGLLEEAIAGGPGGY